MQEEPKTIEQRIEEMLIAFAEDTGIEHEPVSAYTYKFLCFITQIVEEARSKEREARRTVAVRLSRLMK